MASTVLKFTVASHESGQRLDEFLQAQLAARVGKDSGQTAISRGKVRRLIMAGAVRIDGRPMKLATAILGPRQEVSVSYDPAKFLAEKPADDVSFELSPATILYEDEWLIAVDKPANLPTEATIVASRDHLQAVVVRYLTARDGPGPDGAAYVGIHHRLDHQTSGVVLFSKKKLANPGIHRAFAEHLAQKTYLALCAASPKRMSERTFVIENHLGRISPKSSAAKWGLKAGGDWAKTECGIVLATTSGCLVEARPLTGRTHQIRVHLSGYGMPLLGDALYGGPLRLGTQAVARVMLHAARLALPHPISGESLEIESPLPQDFRTCLGLIDKKAGLLYKDQHSRWL